ncbi:MAG TPA: alpha-hydroxy-acid oxidizing protein [Candidatus Anaerostipes avistercoris]|uniref:Alpha-hydroxy-acid oxidizing protein n=1 Tax=Candidatus Anaerostipes avistercoris TaxID=2838462 RepID=A0A9D2PKQ1_9FIRM|nr:alpha-hydroxy-acid oxidizing protein [Candidatus Anaerostipes avistercoris]
MAKFRCSVCGYIYDESSHDLPFSSVDDSYVCPVCSAKKSAFEEMAESDSSSASSGNPLAYPEEFAKSESKEFPQMNVIHQMALTGKSIIDAMGTLKPIISWDDILIMGAQLNPAPLNEGDPVDTTTIIGKKARKPMKIYHPIYVSHMSFGALSKEMKTALAKGSAMTKTAMCSGEGGILPSERQAAYKYIFEYVPNLYSVTEENLKNADAIEIKIGQGTKPGMGGHLPGDKVTEEISKIRRKPMGQDVLSPSKFPNIETRQDLKRMVDWLKEASDGRPIGVKIAAGHVEQDLEWIAYADADFVTIDGRGGATGASPRSLKDNTSIPTIFALHRARKYLDEHNINMDLVITGGLRLPGDFAKALAMGADAVAIASAALVAAGCQQYRICNTGACPIGAATQDPELRKRLQEDKAAKRLANYLNACKAELEMFGRITGHSNIHDLNVTDLKTTNREISEYTNIEHV